MMERGYYTMLLNCSCMCHLVVRTAQPEQGADNVYCLGSHVKYYWHNRPSRFSRKYFCLFKIRIFDHGISSKVHFPGTVCVERMNFFSSLAEVYYLNLLSKWVLAPLTMLRCKKYVSRSRFRRVLCRNRGDQLKKHTPTPK
jgi:hypothetical protein